jgi:hypothetical protein
MAKKAYTIHARMEKDGVDVSVDFTTNAANLKQAMREVDQYFSEQGGGEGRAD